MISTRGVISNFLCFFFVTLIFLLPIAETLAEHESVRLEEIEEAVTLQEAKLAEISIQQAKIDQSLQKSGKEIDAVKKEAEKLEEQQRVTRLEQQEIARAQSATEAEIRQKTEILERRLRALAFESSNGWVLASALQDSRLDMEWISRMLSRVQLQDRLLVSSLSTLKQERAKRASLLAEKMGELALLREAIESNLLSLNAKLLEQRRLKDELVGSKKSIEQVVKSLRAEAMRLEVVVASVTDGAPPPQEPLPPQKLASRTVEPEESFKGVGLQALKGSLSLPVRGMLVRKPPGTKNTSSFDDLVFSKGIELLASPPEVTPVAAGRVVFVGSMPGYGRVAILDHGNRSYSLYAKLQEVKVRVGDEVSAENTIATLGEPDARGSNFYLEIRENGMAVNPKSYFRNL